MAPCRVPHTIGPSTTRTDPAGVITGLTAVRPGGSTPLTCAMSHIKPQDQGYQGKEACFAERTANAR
jgi:hypothetical protein